jgi:hypothetical protein
MGRLSEDGLEVLAQLRVPVLLLTGYIPARIS